jgi:transcriptional regulator with GAF, ATPase, and Fis domain
MTPSLIAISGSLKGATFALTADEVSVGREGTNALCLSDPSISRRHCLIKRQSDQIETRQIEAARPSTSETGKFTVVDLDSFNGTFVNGIPIKEHVLAHGDQIAIGDVLFLFLLHGAEAASPAITLDEGDLITRSTVRLQRQDALYLRPDKVLAELPADARVARDLNTLLRVGTIINSLRDIGQVQQRLLELILEAIPAEREAILLVDESQETFASVCGWNHLIGADQSIKVSRTITNQVLREGVALLSNDIVESEKVGQVPSLVSARVCSLLCVPLVVFEKPLGVIYLDTSNPASRFDEGHLQLLTAIAGIASIALENVRYLESLAGDNQRLNQEIRLEHQMIGESARMRAVYGVLAKVAPSDSTVLIRGESGTGKELAAHAIHINSPRATKPFVAINCATLSESLLESELFGHEKGAFTGAIVQKRGKLEVADGGTVFLDEIGELTLAIQAKLLRVIQERQFERVGGTRPIKVNVRIIAASNRDLETAIAAGSFRQDLYYRVNVVAVTMPSLRERPEDIPLLASYFTGIFSNRCKRRVRGVSPKARRMLQAYEWPGNVRELENAIERAVVLGLSDVITPEDLPESLFESAQLAAQPTKYYEAIVEAKKQIIIKTLDESGGNYTEAAKKLGIHPNNLHRIIKSLNLKSTIQ